MTAYRTHHRRFSVFFFSLLLLLGCGRANNASEGAADATPESSDLPDRQTLRRQYRQFLSAKADTLPARQVKEAGKIYPVDEGLTDTAFFVFREQLFRAVQNKRILPVMECLDEGITVGPPSDSLSGLDAFTRYWDLKSEASTQTSNLWKILEQTLQNGGAFSSGRTRFTAPYYCAAPPGKYPENHYGVITGDGVRLRSAPNLNSRILTMVNFDIVEVLEVTKRQETIGGATHPWIKIRDARNKEGFIWGKFLGRPSDYRAVFEQKSPGKWRMTMLGKIES